MADRQATTLTTFTDAAGREHKVILMAERLLIDVVGTAPPCVIELLGPMEGIEHAKAIVFGTDSEEGYTERAKREAVPLSRPAKHSELRQAARDDDGPDGDDWPWAA